MPDTVLNTLGALFHLIFKTDLSPILLIRHLHLREIHLPQIVQLISGKVQVKPETRYLQPTFLPLSSTVQETIKKSLTLLMHEVEAKRKTHLIARILHFYQCLYV